MIDKIERYYKIFKFKSYYCLTVRPGTGCPVWGYIGIPEGHKYFFVDSFEINKHEQTDIFDFSGLKVKAEVEAETGQKWWIGFKGIESEVIGPPTDNIFDRRLDILAAMEKVEDEVRDIVRRFVLLNN